MKLDWSDIDNEGSKGKEIYNSLRNVLLVRLLLNKIVDNNLLNKEIVKEIGEKIALNLRKDLASKLEKKVVLNLIKNLMNKTEEEINRSKWEKIVL